MSERERRKDERVSFQVAAVIETEGQIFESQPTEDLSLKGIYVDCINPPGLGTPCKVKLEISGLSSQLTLEMEGIVARPNPGQGVGIEFTTMDLDAYSFLKHVVEQNAAE